MDIRKKKLGILAFSVLLQFCVMLGIIQFLQSVLMSFPLAIRAILMIALQWVLLIVPIVFMRLYKIGLSDIGFSKAKLGAQLLSGAVLGIAMSFVLTVLPILAGLKDMVGQTSYTEAWQFCYQFVYMIFGVALVEEFFYRGFLFNRLMDINNSKWFAIIVSSVIFGISHIFIGSLIQVITTSLLGIVFCIFRDKIKNCTTLSLVIAHGMHNALITLFVAIL